MILRDPFRGVFLLMAALVCVGCGALSTHQSPKLLAGDETAWTVGFGAGRLASCAGDTSEQAFGNGCVLTLDPYFGWRTGSVAHELDEANLAHGSEGVEVGFKVSGVPFLGGTVLADLRIQRMTYPIYLSYDFGISAFPCLGVFANDDEDAPEIVDQEKEHSCGDTPFAAGFYGGFTFGAEWLYVGMKYGIGGSTWDGLQLLPGINIGSALGSRRFKIIPAVDVYFYQWPMDTSPELRILYGVGLQVSN